MKIEEIRRYAEALGSPMENHGDPRAARMLELLCDVAEAAKKYFEGRKPYREEGYSKHDACIDALAALEAAP